MQWMSCRSGEASPTGRYEPGEGTQGLIIPLCDSDGLVQIKPSYVVVGFTRGIECREEVTGTNIGTVVGKVGSHYGVVFYIRLFHVARQDSGHLPLMVPLELAKTA